MDLTLPQTRLGPRRYNAAVSEHSSSLPISVLSVFLFCACTNGVKTAKEPAAAADSSIDSGVPQQDSGDSPQDSGSPPEQEAHPSLGPIQSCDAPMAAPAWRERGVELGLPDRPDDGRLASETYLAVDDLDGDGDLDVIASVFGHAEPGQPVEPVTLYWWTGERFETEALTDVEIAWAPTLADMDGDGDMDILTPGHGDWLRNDGGDFWPVPWAGIPEERLIHVREFEAYDLNGDGHLDLFGLSTHQDSDPVLGSDIFLWGNADGSFVEAEGVIPPLDPPGSGFDSFWIDWFGDGQPEMFVANDRGAMHAPNALLQWNGERFEDIAPSLGLDLAHDAMGADAGDFNRDGVPDLYITATNNNVLMLSQPDGVHADVATALNADPVQGTLSELAMGWGGLFVDHDNDGHLDLFTTQGDWWYQPEDRVPFPLQLLRFDGSQFVDVSAETGLTAEGSFRGAISRDFNGDGILDFLVSSVFGHAKLFMSDGCTQNTWLSVTAPQSARIQVSAGDTVWTDWAKANSSFGGHARPFAHFGLGDLEVVDRIEVVLPGGEVFEIDGPIGTRRHVQIPPVSP